MKIELDITVGAATDVLLAIEKFADQLEGISINAY